MTDDTGPRAAGLAMLRHQLASAFAYDKPAKLGVAVSGGGDSIALLRLLADWAQGEGVALEVVTVNHALRPEAASEARFVAQTCDTLDLKHDTLTWTDWDGHGNVQDAARRARYSLMAQWAKDRGIDTIALGHTADDQAETFFMRLARASGIDGLTGMQRRRTSEGITWVRPLLMQERSELRDYLRRLKQVWIDDPTNEDETYDRVKARKAMEQLKPLGLDMHVVGRVMDHLGQVRSALDFATHDHALDCISVEGGDLILNRRGFMDAAPEINRRLVAHALRWIASADYGPRGVKLQEFLAAISRGRDATLHGVRLLGGSDTLRMTREHSAVVGATCGVGQVWDGRWRVQGSENAKEIVRALGDDGLAQLGERQQNWPPRESLKSSPAIFRGPILVSAPAASFGVARAELIFPSGHFYTSLLSH
ncbi:tRNA lysidine(34) synthetase TilS [Celeribacter marinus]|uniref:tRNA(Ile)-lysidine synthase n=1 Tax=Celeribacter marinus TaxID=1397108 RepID=A0A0P0ACR6_9RHOB|nr:tRNA lysidine(34) synthetase TilS [Celeribacter marinus]ALI56655.1 tRNA(Ile)-lysidine synthetase [Celeribacter marinus]SFK62079.1 tRNA(Ile)-lysidine synthase [Celeribacter marinus]